MTDVNVTALSDALTLVQAHGRRSESHFIERSGIDPPARSLKSRRERPLIRSRAECTAAWDFGSFGVQPTFVPQGGENRPIRLVRPGALVRVTHCRIWT